MVIVPIASEVKTDDAHKEVLGSTLFNHRLKRIGNIVETMKRSIYLKDVAAVSRLAEECSLPKAYHLLRFCINLIPIDYVSQEWKIQNCLLARH